MTKAIPMNGRMVRTTFAVIELLSVVRYINSRIANIMLVTVIFSVLYSFIPNRSLDFKAILFYCRAG